MEKSIKFVIDDLEYFRREFLRQNPELTSEQVADILCNLNDFKAIYTLYQDENGRQRYELTDVGGNNINLSDLNGYQKGVIINDCWRYFNYYMRHGKAPEEYKDYSDTEMNDTLGVMPCGVIEISVADYAK